MSGILRRMAGPGSESEHDAYTVVVADDHNLVRKALRTLLDTERDFRVVAEAATAADVHRVVGAYEPDALVLDWTMPGAKGLETLRHVAATWPRLVIVSFSMNDPLGFEGRALAAGATAWVSKDEPATLVERLRDALRVRGPLHMNI